jgi:hypothetical protein
MVATVYTPKRQPSVGINQRVIAGGVILPEISALPSVLIGLKKNVISSKKAGTYTTGSPNELTFPSYETGAQIYKDSVELQLQNIVLAITETSLASVYPSSGTRPGTVKRNRGPGTVSNLNLGTTVTGVGTTFTTTFDVGDNITIGAATYIVDTITSDTVLDVTVGITGANSGVVYRYDLWQTIIDGTADFVTNAKVNDFISITHG